MRRTAAAVLLTLLVAGCSSGGDDASSAGSSGDAGTKAGAPAARPQAAPAALKALAVPRSVIRTAELDVQVRDARDAADRAEDLVRAVGGEVADEDLDLRVAEPTAALQLLVPPGRLLPVLDDLAALGEEERRRLGSTDVTEQVVDLDSRIATQRSSVLRVRDLLERASALSDVVRLEAELSKRQAELESLQARMRALSGQVVMSRVTLRLTTGAEPEPVAANVGFVSGLRGGWSAFLAATRVAGAAVGALLPFLPLLLLGGWLTWRLRRRAATA